MRSDSPRLMYVVAEDWFFCSHFFDRAIAARNAGYDVSVVTRVGSHATAIEQAGLRLIHMPMDRRSLSPMSMFRTWWAMFSAYRRLRPALVHHVALKPVLLGTLAARASGVRHVVNAVVGMGYVFTSRDTLAKTLRPVLRLAMRLLLNPRGSRVIFENSDDLESMLRQGCLRREDAVLIRGAGVNPALFMREDRGQDVPVIVLAARMLWDKGVGEFVEAARLLRREGLLARFVLVGDADHSNRAAIDVATLEGWKDEAVVEWWGFRPDIPVVLAQADIACLPSYREGLPKSLLEAMAAGLPCVTTDVPGCREAVRHEDNGLLVPPRDAPALAAALRRLLVDSDLRARMGARGRERVHQEFSSSHVVRQTLALYETMLAASGNGAQESWRNGE